MKIVNLTDFLALPDETLFSKYAPCYFENMQIKTSNCGEHDFIAQSIEDAIECRGSEDFSDKLDDAERLGVSLKMDFNCTGRDGCFDEDQLFAVWEHADLEALIERLQVCLKAAP